MSNFGLVVIGAHSGVWLKSLLDEYQNQNILLVEPVPYNISLLKEITSKYKNTFLNHLIQKDTLIGFGSASYSQIGPYQWMNSVCVKNYLSTNTSNKPLQFGFKFSENYHFYNLIQHQLMKESFLQQPLFQFLVNTIPRFIIILAKINTKNFDMEKTPTKKVGSAEI